MSTWPNQPHLDAVRSRGVTAVAQAFGLELTRGRGLTPCPACGATTRHPKRRDPRGAIGVRPDDRGWQCFECGATGDALTLAALRITGVANPRRERWPEILRACAAVGLGDAMHPRGFPPGGAPSIQWPHSSAGHGAPKRPPPDEVIALWDACRAVTRDAEVAAWLRDERHLDPAAVQDFDLARAIPRGNLPRWARFRGQPWTETTHRLIVPMYGPMGQVESLHARALAPKLPGDKAASPAGAGIGGLVMANDLARLMLGGRPLASGTPAAAAVSACGLWIAEGLPDFLALATYWSDANERAPAVLGVIAGSWTDEIAARVPDGCSVVIATHMDEPGEKYAARIQESLASRPGITLRRWKARGG